MREDMTQKENSRLAVTIGNIGSYDGHAFS